MVANCVVAQGVLRTLNFIGRSSSSSGSAAFGAMAGNIDEFRIWNYSLTQQQLHVGMHSALHGSELGLLLYYKFDEGAGSTALNFAVATGSGFNGALHNGAAYGSSSPLSTAGTFSCASSSLSSSSSLDAV